MQKQSKDALKDVRFPWAGFPVYRGEVSMDVRGYGVYGE